MDIKPSNTLSVPQNILFRPAVCYLEKAAYILGFLTIAASITETVVN